MKNEKLKRIFTAAAGVIGIIIGFILSMVIKQERTEKATIKEAGAAKAEEIRNAEASELAGNSPAADYNNETVADIRTDFRDRVRGRFNGSNVHKGASTGSPSDNK